VPHLRHQAALASVVGGLLGGLIGAGVMSAGHALITTIAGDGSRQPAKGDQEEDATVKVADRVSQTLRRRTLAPHEKTAASHLVHGGFGALMGALYGAAASVWPAVAVGAGTGFGAAVWLGAHATVVPVLALAPSPLREPPGKEARELMPDMEPVRPLPDAALLRER
jgi:putative membrane protein